MEQINFVDDFFYKKLPEEYFEMLVEFENVYQKNKFIKGVEDLEIIEELAFLYKQGVEFYCNCDKEMEKYFSDKLKFLLSNDKVIKLLEENIEPCIPQRTKRSQTVANKSSALGFQENEIPKNTFERKYSFGKQKNIKSKYSLKFRMVMNKIAVKKDKLPKVSELEKKSEENFENGRELVNKDIEEQEKNFKLSLEKIRRKKKIFRSNSLVNSVNQTPDKLLRRESSSSRRLSRLSSDITDSGKKEEISLIANNSSLSFVSKRKRSINYYIDKFLIWMFQRYFEKFSENSLRKVLKIYEKFYSNKKEIYLKFEEEIFTMKNLIEIENKDTHYEESIKLIIDSLVMERNEKFGSEDLGKYEEILFIKEKGKKINFDEEVDIIKSINDLTEKIMSIFI